MQRLFEIHEEIDLDEKGDCDHEFDREVEILYFGKTSFIYCIDYPRFGLHWIFFV